VDTIPIIRSPGLARPLSLRPPSARSTQFGLASAPRRRPRGSWVRSWDDPGVLAGSHHGDVTVALPLDNVRRGPIPANNADDLADAAFPAGYDQQVTNVRPHHGTHSCLSRSRVASRPGVSLAWTGSAAQAVADWPGSPGRSAPPAWLCRAYLFDVLVANPGHDRLLAAAGAAERDTRPGGGLPGEPDPGQRRVQGPEED
jgi:hypothetical protein